VDRHRGRHAVITLNPCPGDKSITAGGDHCGRA
jgi:hypothetical protein